MSEEETKKEVIEFDNLDVWNSLRTPDPKFVKNFDNGSFKGSTINPTYLMKRMTEMFGPAGIGWGWNIIDEKYQPGHTSKNNVTTVVHILQVVVWYKPDIAKPTEVFHVGPHYGQTTFCGERSSGKAYTDEEAPKKSLTDGLVKCMVALGLGADIHMGLWDDNKYVNDATKKFKAAEAKPEPNVSEKQTKLEPSKDVPMASDQDIMEIEQLAALLKPDEAGDYINQLCEWAGVKVITDLPDLKAKQILINLRKKVSDTE